MQESSWGAFDPQPLFPSIPLRYYSSKLKRKRGFSYSKRQARKASPKRKMKKRKSLSPVKRISPTKPYISYAEFLKTNPTHFPDPNRFQNKPESL
jgi:hypothetical protein